MSLSGTLLFHLNLNYSSIEEEARPEVVARCYWPLLGLLDDLPSLSLALEASAHTLELIAAIDKRWLARLRERIGDGRVELIGSGDTQLIGPLVPAEVNRWNQKLGMAAYERLLGERPTTALVNEMAWSQGLVDAYASAGYQAVVAEWENPRRAHPEWQDEWRYQVHWTESPSGERIRLHFASAIAFQKLQRAAAREIDAREYLRWIRSHVGERPRHLFVYAGDAEVFDFRPGRYATEPRLGLGGEWLRLRRLLALLERAGVRLTTPARLRASADFAPARALVLASAADPIPVKKQPKYNVTRWALSGVDDLEWNSRASSRCAAARGPSGAICAAPGAATCARTWPRAGASARRCRTGVRAARERVATGATGSLRPRRPIRWGLCRSSGAGAA